ncbi:MAG: hypothetical protein IJ191_01510 [Treponema sp.]|nr:hypothetical protein [Treponema sp.]
MNTIPTIFNERQINMTVLGGRQKPSHIAMDVAVILLNSSGSHFRVQVLENPVTCGFSDIISLEPHRENRNIEETAHRFPSVKFIVPLDTVTDGDMINIGMSETDASHVLVLRDSLAIPHGVVSPKLVEHVLKLDCYCVAPRLIDAAHGGVAVRSIPFAERGHLHMEMTAVVTEGAPTVYPFDIVGLYNREKFIRLGGFDYTILSPYYQNMDLALRSWLWGERTVISPSFLLSYAGAVPVETMTADVTYLHCYLKNMLPVFKIDHGVISPFSFFRFFYNSSCGFFESRRLFKDAVRWTTVNRYRFKTDIKHLVENWGAV